MRLIDLDVHVEIDRAPNRRFARTAKKVDISKFATHVQRNAVYLLSLLRMASAQHVDAVDFLRAENVPSVVQQASFRENGRAEMRFYSCYWLEATPQN